MEPSRSSSLREAAAPHIARGRRAGSLGCLFIAAPRLLLSAQTTPTLGKGVAGRSEPLLCGRPMSSWHRFHAQSKTSLWLRHTPVAPSVRHATPLPDSIEGYFPADDRHGVIEQWGEGSGPGSTGQNGVWESGSRSPFRHLFRLITARLPPPPLGPSGRWGAEVDRRPKGAMGWMVGAGDAPRVTTDVTR